jgi:hypothetical protein
VILNCFYTSQYLSFCIQTIQTKHLHHKSTTHNAHRIEPSIRAAGNFYAILGFIVFPFVWALPEALVTAELGAAFQDPSAGVAWVEEAFGETLGGLCGYLGWISGATDNVRSCTDCYALYCG